VYLLYLDESGNPESPEDTHFVVGGLAVFERVTYWLNRAVEDVQARFGRTLDDFLAKPTGTMAVVLSRQIILTPEQKQVAIQKLREAFAEHQKQKAAGGAAVAAAPAAH